MRYNKSSMSLIRNKAGLAVIQSKGNTSMYVLFQVKGNPCPELCAIPTDKYLT